MNSDEAIKLLEQDLKDQFNNQVFGLNVAKALSIEALERCQHNYLNPQRADFRLLPSETKD